MTKSRKTPATTWVFLAQEHLVISQASEIEA